MTFEEWSNEQQKKKKNIADIAPVAKKANTAAIDGNGKTSGWFQKGAFDDGYQFGDGLASLFSTVGDFGVNAVKGVGGLIEGISDAILYGAAGISDLFGADDFSSNMKESAKINLIDDAFAPMEQAVNQNSFFGDKMDGVSQAVGQVAGILATGGIGSAAGLGTIGVTALTTGLMGASSFGSGMSEAYQSGATDGEALSYGLIKGAVDAGTELIFGGLGKAVRAVGLSKGLSSLDDLFAKKVSSKISSQFWKNAAEFGVKASAEGVEEVLAGIGSAFGKWFTYASEEELKQLIKDENLLDQFIAGSVAAGVAQSGILPGTKSGSLREAKKTGRDFITGLTANEQSVIDAEYESRIAQAEKNGERLTKKEKNEIYESVESDLKKGYISVDRIESVLGKGRAQTDEYWMESYRERDRRGQAFEADLSRYDEKQQGTIQRAMDSGILNNTRRTHEFVDMIARISADKGVSFDFTGNDKLKESGFAVDGKIVNGYVTADGIMINIESRKALNTVVGHEISHVLEGTELYGELQTALFAYAKAKGDYAARRSSLEDLYKGVKDADIDAELTADLVGDYLFTDADFLSRLSTNHRNIFQKMYDEIKYLCKAATAGSKQARELEKVKRAFEAAYRESGKGTKNTADGGVRYSIVQLEDGRVYVEADRKVINGDTRAEQRREITNFFSELLENNSSLDIHTIEGDVLTLTKAETANKARDDFKTVNGKKVRMSDHEFAVKLHIESHMDEVTEVSTKIGKEADHNEHSFAKDGFSYRRAYFKDFDGQYYEVTLSIGHSNGVATVYNVGKIKEGVPPSAKIIAVAGSQPLGKTLSNNSISQNFEKSTENAKKSLSVENDEIAPMAENPNPRAFEAAYKEGGILRKSTKYSLHIKHTDGSVEELADARNLTNEQAIDYLNQAKSGVLQGHSYIPVRKDTPQVIIDTLKQVNEEISNASLVMQVRKAQQAMSTRNRGGRKDTNGSNIRAHALTPTEIVDIINQLDDPTTIIYQTNRQDQRGNSLPNNVAVFVDYHAGNNEGVAVIEFESSIDPAYIGNEVGDVSYHTVVTVFEPDVKRQNMKFDYAEELLTNPDNIELEIQRRQSAGSATQEKHPNASSKLPSIYSIPQNSEKSTENAKRSLSVETDEIAPMAENPNPRAFEAAYRESGNGTKNTADGGVRYSLEQVDGISYVRAEKNIFVKEDGTLASEREVFNSLVGKTIHLPDGDVKIVKRLPNKDMYNELSRRYPKQFDDIEDIKQLNSNVNYNMEELIGNSEAETLNVVDKDGRHAKQGITGFDTRTVKFYDGSKAYDVQFSIAKLQSGEKIAYAKKYFGYNAELTKKIQTAEIRSEQSPLNQQSATYSISQNSEKSTGNAKKSLSAENDEIAPMAENPNPRAFEAAYRESGKETKNTVDGGVRYSIVQLEDGRVYVEADRKVINGDTRAEQRREITNFFSELLENNSSLDVYTIEGDVLTITKDETANKARDDYKTVDGNRVKLSDEEFAVKLNVEAHIDEVTEVSTKKGQNQDTKDHSFAKDGFTYRRAYFKDFDGQYYEVTLSIGHSNGVATVYNVGKIKEGVPPSAKIIAVVGSQPLGKTPSNNSISQNSEKSTENAKKSLSTKEDIAPIGNYNVYGNVKYSLSPEARNEVRQALNDKSYAGEIKLTDSSPSILLSQKGVRNLPMIMNASHIRENIFTEDEAKSKGLKVNKNINYHGLGEDLFFKVIDELDSIDEAYRGTKNAEKSERRENYFLLISKQTDSDGNIINIPIYINEKGLYNRVFIDTNKISTVFGRSELRRYISEQIKKGNLTRVKKRSIQTGESTSPINADYGKNTSNNSIPQNSEKSTENAKKSLSAEPDELAPVMDSGKGTKNTADGGVRYSITEKPIDKYTEKQYNDFGWARHAEAISKNELDDMYSKIQEKGSLKKLAQSSKGEAIIEVNDNPHTTLGVDNVFVFVTGTKNNPQISKVVRFEAETDTEMEFIKEKLYERGSFSNSCLSFFMQYGLATEYSRKSALDYLGYEEEIRRRSGGTDRHGADGDGGFQRDGSGTFEQTRSNEIAPVKEASKDGSFFDGKNSLSDTGDELGPIMENGKGTKNTAEGGVKYSLEYDNAIDQLADNELDRTQNTHLKLLDHTPKLYVDKAGAKDLKIIMAWDIAYLAMNKNGDIPGHYHGLGSDVMKDIPRALQDPLFIVKQDNGRIIAVTELVVKGNRSTIASIELDTFKSTTQDGNFQSDNYNLIVTIMDAKPNYLQNTIFGGDIVYNKNNEDPTNFILRLKSLKKALPNDDLARSSIYSIPQNSEKSTENAKRSLSVEQDEIGPIMESGKGTNSATDGGVRYSIAEKSIDKYTEKQYNDFGWARDIEAISKNELDDLYFKVQEKGFLKRFSQSSSGEAIIEVNDNPHTTLGVDNVFVFVTGTKNEPEITRLVRINFFDEESVDIFRKDIYANSDHRSLEAYARVMGEEFFRYYDRSDCANYGEYTNKTRSQQSGSEGEGDSRVNRKRTGRNGTFEQTQSNEIAPVKEASKDGSFFDGKKSLADTGDELAPVIDSGKGTNSVTDGGVRYSIAEKSIDKYTQKQYNDFGWARHAEAISKNELNDMYSKIHEKGSLKKFAQSSKGEAIIEVNDKPHTTLGVENVFVFVTGTKNNPQINKVVRFEVETDTEMEIIKEKLYERGSFGDTYYSFLIKKGFATEYSRKSALDYLGYTQAIRRGSVGADRHGADGDGGFQRDGSGTFEQTRSNEIAPVKEASKDGSFFDGKKSLSDTGDELAPIMESGKVRNSTTDGGVKYSLSEQKNPTHEELISKKPAKIVSITDGIKSGSYVDMKAAAMNKAKSEGWFDVPHHNADTDSLIFLTEKSFTHAYSNLTADFGEDTIRCMAHIPEIIRESVLVNVADPKNSRKKETKVYTFFGAIEGVNGIEPVKLTVKEFDLDSLDSVPKNIRSYFEKNGIMRSYNSLYDAHALEVIGIEGAKKESDASGKVGGQSPRAQATSDSAISIANLLNLVKGDAEKYIPKRSLSAEGDELGPVGKYNVYGKDIAFDAPVREDIGSERNNAKGRDIGPVKDEAAKETAKILAGEHHADKKKNRTLSHFTRNIVDKFQVFENLSYKTKNKSLRAKVQKMRDAEAAAQYFIGKGADGVRSMRDIQSEVMESGHNQEFQDYMYHSLNIDRMTLEDRYEAVTNKTVTGDSAEVSREIVAELEAKYPQFKKWAKEVYANMNYLKKVSVDGGILSQELSELWAEMYPHYVPVNRVDEFGVGVNVPLFTEKTGVNTPFKRATGGTGDIGNLFDTMAKRAEQTYKAVAKNSFGVELKNTLASTIQRTKASLDETMDSIDNHEKLLKKGGKGKKPTFTVFENGERVEFEITEDMYEALLPTSDAMSETYKIPSAISKGMKGLLTEYNLTFMLTNAGKDAQDMFINSKHARKTYAAIPEAIKALTQKEKNHWYVERMANGGANQTYFDRDTNTFTEEKTGVRKWLGKISEANNFIEQLPRMAEYIASRKAGASIEEAMLDAAEVTTNFSAGGDVTKWANRNGATFLNASIQGAAQQVRNFRDANAKGFKGWLGLAAKFAVAGLPVLLLNHLLWDDDEDYEDLSDYVKDQYYIVAKYGDGQFVKIPKGRTLAVIQDAFEQIGNAVTGNDEVDFQNFFTLVMNNLAPNNPIDSNILAPILQVANNETWYGEDLVPTRLQDLPNAEQYDESTDSLSKWLGEKTNFSPYKIHYLLDQYSGGLGDVFLPMLTPEAESGDNSLLGTIGAPLKDKFTTDSVMNNQNISDFYDIVDELTKNAKSSKATDEDVLKYKYIHSVQSELSDLYAEKREIQNSDFTDAEKYEAARDIQKRIDALAKTSLNAYQEVYIDGDYAMVGDRHYRLTDKGEWQKLTEKQLEDMGDVTSGLGIHPSVYWSNQTEYDFAYKSPEKYAVAKSVGGYGAYKTYTSELYDIKADKDASGKTISGSRKKKVIAYINSLDADYGQRMILFKSQYKADDTYNEEIIEYLNSREDISYEEMEAILKELGFTVKSDGTITW